MRFKEIFSKYESYSNNKMNMNKIDMKLVNDICYVLPEGIKKREKKSIGKGYLNTDDLLKKLCDLASKYTSSERTTNWGWDFIINDYFEYIAEFENKKFHKFMDFIAEAIFTIKDDDTIYEVNEILAEYNVGYRLADNRDTPWALADNITVEKLEDVIESLEQISLQAVEHIKQVKMQLSDANSLRARKDAIRDCLSANETIIKKITGEKSYEKASTFFLTNEKEWGSKFIVADSINIWKRFHENYKDIRHGNDNISEISLEETLYYIDRILAFVNYIVKRAKVNGKIDA